jgi:hypothetical protein
MFYTPLWFMVRNTFCEQNLIYTPQLDSPAQYFTANASATGRGHPALHRHPIYYHPRLSVNSL